MQKRKSRKRKPRDPLPALDPIGRRTVMLKSWPAQGRKSRWLRAGGHAEIRRGAGGSPGTSQRWVSAEKINRQCNSHDELNTAWITCQVGMNYEGAHPDTAPDGNVGRGAALTVVHVPAAQGNPGGGSGLTLKRSRGAGSRTGGSVHELRCHSLQGDGGSLSEGLFSASSHHDLSGSQRHHTHCPGGPGGDVAAK